MRGWDERRREEMRGEDERRRRTGGEHERWVGMRGEEQEDVRSIHANHRKACCQPNGNCGTQVFKVRATTQITFHPKKKKRGRNIFLFCTHCCIAQKG